jgi:hypothetical protein
MGKPRREECIDGNNELVTSFSIKLFCAAAAGLIQSAGATSLSRRCGCASRGIPAGHKQHAGRAFEGSKTDPEYLKKGHRAALDLKTLFTHDRKTFHTAASDAVNYISTSPNRPDKTRRSNVTKTAVRPAFSGSPKFTCLTSIAIEVKMGNRESADSHCKMAIWRTLIAQL